MKIQICLWQSKETGKHFLGANCVCNAGRYIDGYCHLNGDLWKRSWIPRHFNPYPDKLEETVLTFSWAFHACAESGTNNMPTYFYLRELFRYLKKDFTFSSNFLFHFCDGSHLKSFAAPAQNQGCQIFLVQNTKTGKIYQITTKYTKWP
jgi:hypothetical protein